MNVRCYGCYQILEEPGASYHPACAEKTFGVRWAPHLDLSLEDFPRVAQEMAGKMSISGVQPKIIMELDHKTKTLQPAPSGGSFVVKPQNNIFPDLPQNEDLGMHLAALYGISVPPHGLIKAKDGSFAYLIKRFDRTREDIKLAVEDFTQILETTNKYSLSYEQIGNAILRLCTNKFLDLQRYFERLLFCWVIGNGDMHLKNFSLMTNPEGEVLLAPAYDLLSSKLVIPGEEDLAISMRGKKNKIKRKDFLEFALEQGLNQKAVENSIQRLLGLQGDFFQWTNSSFLPKEQKIRLTKIIKERFSRLGPNSILPE